MQTSARGIAALEHEEGVVLKAYRCPAGVWTIGAGLTAASGVVKPKPGMVITREEASALLAEALRKNYEPAVRKAMPRTLSYEFDAGVSFHFNTGAIHKASWVKLWLRDVLDTAHAAVRASLLQWNKGGGKVLPGLTARRNREADMLLDGKYPAAVAAAPRAPVPALGAWAVWGLNLSSTEKAAARDALARLGYKVGDKLDAVALVAARAFQRDHDLTVDGILGRASLSTLQRRLDARGKGLAPVGAAAVAAPVATVGTPPEAVTGVPLPEGLEFLPLAGAGLWALHYLWAYRDHVAYLIHDVTPRLAAFLRSF
jgi:lysozyme